ncbi:MAG: ATP-binding protein [Alphaproteobacteria bacterium]|nr:ATP-binding protein [Alphaproteobacteria bacterium]
MGTLAGGIAHEFKNLLLPVRLLSEATRDQQPPESQSYDNLEKVIEACRQAQILVDNILTFGQQKAAERRSIDLGSTVAEALDLARISLRETIRVELHIEDREAHTVFADPTQIYQIVFNLINNAVDAMAEEGGAIRISVESQLGSIGVHRREEHGSAPARSVILRVSDNGRGMDRATSDKAFDPFFTTSRRGTGSGMGLAVVHGIVSALGGTVEIESTAHVGTEVVIALPSYTSDAVRVWSPSELHEAASVESTNMDVS